MATLSEAQSLRPALDDFVEDFSDCIKTTPSQRHFRTYVAGQVGPVQRKTVEAIADEAGEAPRTLQQFLGAHRWDEDKVAKRVRERVRDRYAGPNGIGILDETCCPKDGKSTVGVQRQYCGATGKVDNCVATVGLGYVNEAFYGLLDTDLFLPEKTWGTDKALRAQAGVPKDVAYRPKWVIACELVERALEEAVPMGWITADELYGRCAGFRNRIAATGLTYVLEVPVSTRGWRTRPTVEPAGTITNHGKTLKHPRVAPGEKEARRVDELWKRGGPSWREYRVKDTTKGPQIWQVRETRFYPSENKVPGPEQRLIIARNVLTGEMKYFLSNAASDAPVGTLLYVAFTRWHVEKVFRESKSRVGFDHFEVRTYRSVKRHLILSGVSHLFLVEQALRLKEKTPGWTVPQVRRAIEVQLDDEMSGRERLRQVKKVLRKINLYQKRNAKASAYHDDSQRDRLHEVGVDLRRAKRCVPPW